MHLSDCSDLEFDEMRISGNSKQEKREGYNLFDYLGSIKETVETLNTNIEDDTGYVIVNGTAERNYLNILKSPFDITDKLKIGKTYTLWQEKHGSISENTGVYLQIIERKSDGSSVNIYSRDSNKTFTVIEGSTYTCSIQTGTVEGTGTLVNYKNRYMIYEGTDDKEFELYGAMPSIENPSETEACGDDVNLFDKNTITKGYRLGADGTNAADKKFFTSDYIEVKPNIYYTVNYIVNSYARRICYYDVNKEFIIETIYNSTYKTPNNCKYMRICSELSELDKIKLQEGEVATAYSPFAMGSINVSKSNRNLLDYNKLTIVNRDFSVLPVIGKELSYFSTTKALNFIIPVAHLRGRTVTYSNSSKYLYKRIFELDKEYKVVNVSESTTKNIHENTSYLSVVIKTAMGSTEDISVLANDIEAQLEEGTEVTEYIPHQSQTHTIYTQQLFHKDDTFEKIEGKWYEKHNINRYILTGDETWNKNYGEHLFNVSLNTLLNDKFFVVGKTAYSNCYIYNPVQSNINNQTVDKEFALQHYVSNNYSGYALFIKDEDYNTIEEFKEKLKQLYIAGRPVYIDYALENPVYLSCTEEQCRQLDKLQQSTNYKNETIIYSTDEVSPQFDITYRKDLQSELDNIKQEIKGVTEEVAREET